MSLVILLIHVLGKSYIQTFVENTEIIDRAFSNLKTYSIIYVLDGFQ